MPLPLRAFRYSISRMVSSAILLSWAALALALFAVFVGSGIGESLLRAEVDELQASLEGVAAPYAQRMEAAGEMIETAALWLSAREGPQYPSSSGRVFSALAGKIPGAYDIRIHLEQAAGAGLELYLSDPLMSGSFSSTPARVEGTTVEGEWYARALWEGRRVWTDQGAPSAPQVCSVPARVEGKVVGAVGIGLDSPSLLASILDDALLSFPWAALFDKEARPLSFKAAAGQAAPVWLEQSLPEVLRDWYGEKDSKPSTLHRFSRSGQSIYYARVLLPNNWQLLAMVPRHRVTKSLDSLALGAAFVLLIGLALTGLAARLIGRSVARPLAALSAEASRVAVGEPRVLELPENPLEIRSLTEAFNRAFSALRSKSQSQRLLLAGDSRMDLLSLDLAAGTIGSQNGFEFFGLGGEEPDMPFTDMVARFRLRRLEADAAEGERGRALDGPSLLRFLQALPRGRVMSVDLLARDAKDAERVLRLTILKESSGVALGACIDRTEEVRTRKEGSRVILESLAEGVIGLDGAGRCVFANAQAERLFGMERDELIGSDLRQLLAPRDSFGETVAKDRDPVAIALEQKVSASVGSGRFMRRDGSFFIAECRSQPLFRSGKPAGAVLTFNDVSESAALSSRFRALQANAIDMIYIIDMERRLVSVSRSMLPLLRLPFEALALGRRLEEFFPEALAEEHGRREAAVLATGQSASDLPLVIPGPEGEERHWRLSIMPYRDEAGVLSGAFGMIHDVTEDHRLEAELRAAKEEAERANHAKSLFIASMSHEIRTPLNSILGYSQLMAADPSLPEKPRERAQTIFRSGEHLLDLIDSILEFSNIETGRSGVFLSACELSRLVGDISGMMRIRAEAKALSFDARLDPSLPPWILTDARKLRQILINLLGNAIKFTERGSVSLKVFQKSGLDGTDWIVFEIEDSGAGIGEEELSALFRPFAPGGAGPDAREGAGLGLSISRDYARLLKGELSAESQKGRGSIFRCELPLVEAAASPTGDGRAEDEKGIIVGISSGNPSPLVLHAEDEALARELVRDILEPVGFRLIEAENGREALGKAREASPDLILMDLRLPGMDGYAAMEGIRAGGFSAPILALSASVFEEDRTRARAAGADAFLRKPVDGKELLKEIGGLLGLRYRRAPDQPMAGKSLASNGLDASGLPPGLRERLRVAAVELAPFQVSDLAQEAEAHDPAAAAAIRSLLSHYDFQAIIDACDAKGEAS